MCVHLDVRSTKRSVHRDFHGLRVLVVPSKVLALEEDGLGARSD